MKRYLAAILIILVLLPLAACSDRPAEGREEAVITASPQPDETPGQTAAPTETHHLWHNGTGGRTEGQGA